MTTDDIVEEVIRDLNNLTFKYSNSLGMKTFSHEVLIYAVTGILDKAPSRSAALKHIESCIQEVISCWQEVQEE